MTQNFDATGAERAPALRDLAGRLRDLPYHQMVLLAARLQEHMAVREKNTNGVAAALSRTAAELMGG